MSRIIGFIIAKQSWPIMQSEATGLGRSEVCKKQTLLNWKREG